MAAYCIEYTAKSDGMTYEHVVEAESKPEAKARFETLLRINDEEGFNMIVRGPFPLYKYRVEAFVKEIK